jgi:hypothetical protein
MAKDPLNPYVSRYVSKGYEVTSRTPTQVVLSKPRRLGLLWWIVNLILAAITGGLWLIYVIYRVVNKGARQVVFTVQDQGRVKRS